MDWSRFRSEFPVTAHWAFLDHAAVAPLPASAVRALQEYATLLSENGGTAFRKTGDRVAEVRRNVGRLLHCDPLDVAFVPNTSAGLGLVAEGLPWQPGDNVVTAAEEYPANQYPWLNLAGRGVEVRRVPSRGSRIAIDDIRAAFDNKTRLLTLSSVEFASGFRNDLDDLGGLCRERGVLFCVDAIQSLGVFPLDVSRAPIDFLAADGHKWLLGPEGLGVFWCRPELVERLHPIGVGWNSVVGATDFSHIEFRLKPQAGRWEGGTSNFPGIYGFGASLDLLLSAGIPDVAARILELTEYLCEGARRLGWTVFSSRQPSEASGIVSLVIPNADPVALVRYCRARGVAVNHRAGRVRVSPHAYNTTAEIDRFLEAASAWRPGAPDMSALNPRVAVYTGVFDPVHNGHLDIIGRGCRIYERLVVGVGINPEKEPFFSSEERVELLKKVTRHLPNISVRPFTGLAVRDVRAAGAGVMLRGLRTLSDMEYEFTMSLMNLNLDPEIETVFLMAKEEYSHVSSTLLRQVATFRGDLRKFLPDEVRVALEARARELGGE